MAESSASGSGASTGGGGARRPPDFEAIQSIMEQMDSGGDLRLGFMSGEASEGYFPARDLSEVTTGIGDADEDEESSPGVREAAARVLTRVGGNGEFAGSNGGETELDVEEERARDAAIIGAQELQKDFRYPVDGLFDGESERDEALAVDEGDEDVETAPVAEAPAVVSKGEVESAGVDAGRPAVSGSGVIAVESSGETKSGGVREEDGVGGEKEKGLGVLELVGGNPGSEKPVESVEESGEDLRRLDAGMDLVGFVRAGLEGGTEQAVFDQLIRSFEMEGRKGDRTAYDFLLLCGFTATISRRVPRRLGEIVQGLDTRLLKEIQGLQGKIGETNAAMEKIGAIPAQLGSVADSITMMSKKTEQHLKDSQRIHKQSLAEFNASFKKAIDLLCSRCEEVLKRFSSAAQGLTGLFTKKATRASWVNILVSIGVSFAAGFGLCMLFYAAMWKDLEARTVSEEKDRASALVESFRKRVDTAQPQRSILARLDENGLGLSGQPGTFQDIYGVTRKAFILTVRSIGAAKLSEIKRGAQQADLYFSSEP